MRQYTECTVELRQLIIVLEDVMINDRNVTRAHEVSEMITKTAKELSVILMCDPTLRTPSWSPRLVDADTQGTPIDAR